VIKLLIAVFIEYYGCNLLYASMFQIWCMASLKMAQTCWNMSW